MNIREHLRNRIFSFMSGRRHKEQINLLELVPERRFGFSENGEGIVIIDMPRFHVAWMQKYLVPKRKYPFIKIKLDAFGSHVWNLCDGQSTVHQITEALIEKFGHEVQPAYERIGKFFRQLNERGFVKLRKANGSYV